MSDYEPASGIEIADRQQEPPVCHCAECGGEIYPGERVFRVCFTDICYCENCIIEECAE